MALRLDPVRLWIADDVGVGKTIEVLLVARGLYDCAEIRRLCVLCPPYLCELGRLAKALLNSPHDTKLAHCAEAVGTLLHNGFHLIVWCRYIVTAEYVAPGLRKELQHKFPNLCPEHARPGPAACPGEPRPGWVRALCLTYEEKSLGRLQTLCDDGTQAVSTYSRPLDRWHTTITASPRKACTARMNPRTHQVEVRCR